MNATEIYRLYELGKAWRLALTFGVNGAGLLILRPMADEAASGGPRLLAAWSLALWMILFTLVMRRDVHGFCKKMAEEAEAVAGRKPRVYGPSARRFLTRVTGLILSGWLLVAAFALWSFARPD